MQIPSIMPYFLSVFPRKAWRFLPASSVHFGPPRRLAKYARYRKTTGERWIPLSPSQPLQLPDPLLPLPSEFPKPSRNKHSTRELGVALFRDCRVLTQHGWVVGRNDCWLPEFHAGSNSRDSKVYYISKLKGVRRLRGRTLNLGGTWADENFYHWMVDAVPKAEIYLQAFGDWSTLDQILMPKLSTPTTRRIESLLGLPEEKIIRLHAKDHYRCDELLVPSLPSKNGCVFLPWIVEFHRRLFTPAQAVGASRLFINRKGNREIENHQEITPWLEAEGFIEASEDIDVLRGQLAAATHIVGVHGAALANLVYAQPGTRLLELIPTSNPWPCFRDLSAAAGLSYAAISCQSLHHRRHRFGVNTTANFVVKPADFRAALTALLEK